mmetsp:Transcript_107172/g.268641  ORF Transcript_107172/g.268641 Transcript_107172/m.268641 type:complete len:226 (+) Transcript_107172:1338-2015(+)
MLILFFHLLLLFLILLIVIIIKLLLNILIIFLLCLGLRLPLKGPFPLEVLLQLYEADDLSLRPLRFGLLLLFGLRLCCCLRLLTGGLGLQTPCLACLAADGTTGLLLGSPALLLTLGLLLLFRFHSLEVLLLSSLLEFFPLHADHARAHGEAGVTHRVEPVHDLLAHLVDLLPFLLFGGCLIFGVILLLRLPRCHILLLFPPVSRFVFAFRRPLRCSVAFSILFS